tara:strand:- start:449 stop:1168 length:720 start_codon:yes stop_codon:yes gene_type:complete
MKNKFGIILVKPQLGENIGACARSMKNFGISKLHVVQPKFIFPNNKTKVTSVGAYDIIKKTKIFQNLPEAINDFDIIFSLSARRRDINKKHVSMKEFIKILKHKKDTNIGLMFGPEASGLSNKDLSYSNYILQIPTSKKFKSLNLSHSVTIICYEIFKIINNKDFIKNGSNLKKSSKSQINSLNNHLLNLLNQKNFFQPLEKKQSMVTNINNLIYRLEPSQKELRVLASIISALSKKRP